MKDSNMSHMYGTFTKINSKLKKLDWERINKKLPKNMKDYLEKNQNSQLELLVIHKNKSSCKQRVY